MELSFYSGNRPFEQRAVNLGLVEIDSSGLGGGYPDVVCRMYHVSHGYPKVDVVGGLALYPEARPLGLFVMELRDATCVLGLKDALGQYSIQALDEELESILPDLRGIVVELPPQPLLAHW